MFITLIRNFIKSFQIKENAYVFVLPPEMDKEMGKIAKMCSVDLSEVVRYAMTLYIEIKKRQLNQERDCPKYPFSIFLENEKGHSIEFIDPLKLKL